MRVAQETCLTEAFETIERSFAAATSAELDELMERAFARFGITHFSVDQMRDASGAPVAIHHFGKWPEDWGAHYIAQKHYRHDRVVRHAWRSPAPLKWLDARQRADLDPEEARLFGEASEFGLKDGFMTPVHLHDGSLTAVSVHAPCELRLSVAHEAALRLMSLHYCSYGLMLKHRDRNRPKPVLTERQRECLQWARAGKTSWEIGAIIGISERTVNFHIEEACRRLNVQTRQQAVIEAVVRGLISL